MVTNKQGLGLIAAIGTAILPGCSYWADDNPCNTKYDPFFND